MQKSLKNLSKILKNTNSLQECRLGPPPPPSPWLKTTARRDLFNSSSSSSSSSFTKPPPHSSIKNFFFSSTPSKSNPVSHTLWKSQTRNFINRGILFAKTSNFSKNTISYGSKQGYFTLSRPSRNSWFPSAKGVLWGLIGANVAVFMLWRVADPSFMKENFMISVDNFKSGRVHTMITSAFSQIDIEHLFGNMLGLYFFGQSIGQIYGPQFLLKLYLAGAIGGSIFYLVHHAFMHPSRKSSSSFFVDPSSIPALGASGAVNAIVLLEIFLFPKATLYFNFFIPVPAILLGALIIGKDLYRMQQEDGHISGEAHLGGATVAAIVWAGIKRGWWV
ncbi:hypothetical protein MKW98_004026 [Papaver atlanticum]|uniref:Peptidase S54 rhomboid domain-containing protein n=1 Tax=Papaver atlanticum TaxID=357466 RepID=A0AAD4XNC5_9MAGN|nr:hypothetical protein MKW98_004026 [Papaver atlanticum]